MQQLEKSLGIRFKEKWLLHLALTHSSSVEKKAGERSETEVSRSSPAFPRLFRLLKGKFREASARQKTGLSTHEDNERLEFLGDAVLGAYVSRFLYHLFPNATEGDLSQFRSEIVSSRALAGIAQPLHLGKFLLLGKSMRDEETRPSILAGAFEALLGALYLDRGTKAVESFLAPFIEKKAKELQWEGMRNYKGKLLEILQARYKEQPLYQLVLTRGPHHERTFVVKVIFHGEVLGRGSGKNKKEAEQEAARQALESLQRGTALQKHGTRKKNAQR